MNEQEQNKMNFIVDEEIGLTEENDILETKRYAESLKDTILNAPTPFNIGLYGEWGSGKSSIIKTAQTQLEANKDQKVKFVIYDAWKYANDSFRRMFLKTLHEQLKFDGTNFFDSFYQNTTQDKTIEQKFNWKYLVLILVFGLLLVGLSYPFFDNDTKSTTITIQAIFTIVVALVAFFKNAFTDYKITLSKPAMFAPEQFEEAFGRPFYIDNDANVAALGERWKGAGDNAPDVIFVTLGTGVGGGIIAQGQLLHGVNGSAGEIGHMVVDEDGFSCTCGNIGCLETVASATGIVNIAKSFASQFDETSELRRLILEHQVTAKDVFDYAKKNDSLGQKIVWQFANYLGKSLSQLANALNSNYIVIGGGVSDAGEFLLDKVKEEFDKFAFPTVRNSTKLALATLGNDAGVIGAASLVL